MSPLDERRELVATACRVVVARGLADGLLGHISLRLDEHSILVRCRGPQERGLAASTAADVQVVPMSGTVDGEYRAPNELPIHTAILRARPDVGAVVHVHPEATVALDLAGHEIRPIVGALDIPGAHLAAAGVPVYPRSVLINSAQLADEMLAALGEKSALILRGHGTVVCGATVEEAVLRAIAVDRIARISLRILAAGGTLRPIPAADLAQLPDLGAGLNQAASWRHELDRLAGSA